MLKQSSLLPTLQGTVDGTIVRELLGQLVALTAGTQAKDAGIKRSALVNALAAGEFWWIECSQ